MRFTISNENERKTASIDFVKNRIEQLEMKANECSYTEDISGKLVYSRNAYSEERYMYEEEKRQWEVMLDILTKEAPCTVLDW